MKLLIAIPALNEEASIGAIIQRCLEAEPIILGNSPIRQVAITVVSDGSTDATVERAREFGHRVTVIVFPQNRGYGAAIMEAWARSDADVLGFLDADGTCDPRFFAPLCRRLVEEEADVVLGCRLTRDSRMPPLRRFGNTLFAWLLSALSSEAVRDTASGMRVVRRRAFRHLLPLPAGLHFTPAMSARAMLSDAVKIVEIDMPYAERLGRSKLNVIGDGVRFLRVIVETALLYRPGRLLIWGSGLMAAGAALLMLRPLATYFGTRTVAEWMIYRFLVSALLAQVALLLWGASTLTSRMASIVLHEELDGAGTPFTGRMRASMFWALFSLLIGTSTVLVWPSAAQLWRTGHTDVHWSRFVVAMAGFGAAATISMVRGIDRLLDLVEARVRYLLEHP